MTNEDKTTVSDEVYYGEGMAKIIISNFNGLSDYAKKVIYEALGRELGISITQEERITEIRKALSGLNVIEAGALLRDVLHQINEEAATEKVL